MDKHLSKGVGRWIIAVLILAIPFIFCFYLPSSYLDRSPYSFVPNFPNDLPDNWHETESFRIYGFETGYYSFREKVPAAEFTRFGVHGPIFPVLVGSLAKVFGWELYSPVFYNAAFISIALLILILLVNPTGIQMALLTAMTLTFWPIHLLVVSAYQESLHHAGAIILAALGYRLIRDPQNKAIALSTFFLLIFLTLLRFSWGFFFIPFFFILLGSKKIRFAPILSVLAGILSLGLIMKINGYLAAPGLNVITGVLSKMLTDPEVALKFVFGNVLWNNTVEYFAKPPLEILLRFEMLLLFLALPIVYLAKKREYLREAGIYSYVSATILIPSLLFYIDSGFYRIFSIVFVFSAFLLLISNRMIPVLSIIILHSLFTFGLSEAVKDWFPNLILDPSFVAKTRETFDQNLKYAPPPASPWCNTIMQTDESFDWRVAQAPAGFGLSTYSSLRTPKTDFKSKYLLLTPAEHALFENKDNFQMIGVLPDKKLALFLNKKSACD